MLNADTVEIGSVLVDSLKTANENQTDDAVVYLRFDSASNEFRLTADAYRSREKFICKFSGRPVFLPFLVNLNFNLMKKCYKWNLPKRVSLSPTLVSIFHSLSYFLSQRVYVCPLLYVSLRFLRFYILSYYDYWLYLSAFNTKFFFRIECST